MTSVYLPNSRQNLAAFVSVNSEATDTANYGKMQILQLPSETQISGPSQIANDFQADKGVSQALLQYQQSKTTTIKYGNLLTLPVGNGLLYVQPVYIQRSAIEGSYPVLQFVIASFGKDVGFGQTLDEALRVALGLEEGIGTGRHRHADDARRPESGAARLPRRCSTTRRRSTTTPRRRSRTATWRRTSRRSTRWARRSRTPRRPSPTRRTPRSSGSGDPGFDPRVPDP